MRELIFVFLHCGSPNFFLQRKLEIEKIQKYRAWLGPQECQNMHNLTWITLVRFDFNFTKIHREYSSKCVNHDNNAYTCFFYFQHLRFSINQNVAQPVICFPWECWWFQHSMVARVSFKPITVLICISSKQDW